jgi:hypothetical protein
MASCSSPNDAIQIETAFIRHMVFYGIVGWGILHPKSCLTLTLIFCENPKYERIEQKEAGGGAAPPPRGPAGGGG